MATVAIAELPFNFIMDTSQDDTSRSGSKPPLILPTMPPTMEHECNSRILPAEKLKFYHFTYK